MMTFLSRLFSPDDRITNWTPQRAHQAERAMLIREGIVVEPHFLWSAPAKAREQHAKLRREQSWRKAYQRSVGKVTPFGHVRAGGRR